MAFYLKKFEAMSQYDAYTADTENFIKPNVSLVVDNNTVRYNPIKPETKLVVYYDIQDISSPTTIFTNYDNSVKSIEIDGTLLDSVVTTYQFDSVGEHVIKYEFNNPTKVGNSAPLFNNLTTIKSAVIPNTFTHIGDNAFWGCSGLTNIDIPDSVTSIGNSVFTNCISLTNITVDSNNTVYDSRNNCNAIIETATNTLIQGCENTVIPSGVTSIGYGAFWGCTGLTSVNIPSSVTIISNYAFSYCYSLTSIDIPSGVTSIGDNAFYNCSGLTSIDIPSGVTSIGAGAFNNCISLTSIVIPSGVRSIGSGVFQNCSGLTSVTMPDSVTYIGNNAFYGCIKLTSIDIPSGVTSINNNVFYNCSGLTSIDIPSGVTSIGDSAFQACRGLTSITSNAMTAPTIQSNTFYSIKTGGTLTVPSGSSGYDTWMQNSNYYLGLYNWTKVEQ